MQTSSSHQKQTHVSLWSRSEGTKDGQKTSPNIVVQLLCSRLVEPGGGGRGELGHWTWWINLFGRSNSSRKKSPIFSASLCQREVKTEDGRQE